MNIIWILLIDIHIQKIMNRLWRWGCENVKIMNMIWIMNGMLRIYGWMVKIGGKW